jgi:hypothetical protein
MFGQDFFSSRKVSCCTFYIEIYCSRFVMLVTASSSKHFLVAPILSIMLNVSAGENTFCNLECKRFTPWNFEFHWWLLLQ